MKRFSTAVAITDPLVKYQTLVRSGTYAPDPAQHRLIEYRQRLSQVARLTDPKLPDNEAAHGILALRHHAIWRNPLFRHLLPAADLRDSMALTRILNRHETAMEIDSPKGLFLSGEVGTGKSMLLDLLAHGLPTERKRRWHFNTFMLYTFSQLEKRKGTADSSDPDPDYSLVWMAKKLIDDSPILFLDEFQLPDRAASKILSHLFVAFFQLGGVLVASSNRMPEELQKAVGTDYTPEPAQGLIRRLWGAQAKPAGELYGQSSDFAIFLEVLKARCDFCQMEGAKDWRRREEVDARDTARTVAAGKGGLEVGDGSLEQDDEPGKKPQYYHLCGEDEEAWERRVRNTLSWTGAGEISWDPSTVVVYGRNVCTPLHRNGIAYWSFGRLVEAFGPADYITMASSYHTFIVDQVPVLTMLQKNEARRFITFLDAMYEARCKLVIRADSPPDDLFFPEARRGPESKPGTPQGSDDATYSETVAEVYQDQTSPFRPNVSYYDTESATARYNPDQDSDFGLQRHGAVVDFGNTAAFTGEDERFAYKRAASRLWELCSARWHARTGDWWQPLPAEARHWEGGTSSTPAAGAAAAGRGTGSGEGMGPSVEVQEVVGLAKWSVERLRKQDDDGQ
ncbi:AFG1-like ATPase domain-containing protein [Hirsutella rhossiliensis]|uniref:AFG1-like ATPase domain-containing protein n=1 Tax=Hirsutella rhossiliensis TaxID=111463 RepID=A0A9P8SDV5_9HYPO|nr:AFG1-like ATPase domain-containing protein [Hirsutella rhossiliensis]KAH0958354.1 AFG1-like ATPase domain-containing protein [Hirsutella rhossiliensis]